MSCGGQWQPNWKQHEFRSAYVSLSDSRSRNGHAQSGPLERSLPVDGKGLGRLGHAKLIASIRHGSAKSILFILWGHKLRTKWEFSRLQLEAGKLLAD